MSEEHGNQIALLDHHCHGVVTADLDRPWFEDLMTESPFPPPAGTTNFDSPVGLAVRRWCAPVLDLPAGCRPDEYLERRRELGAVEANRRLLRATGSEALLVDTGYRSDAITPPPALSELAAAPAHEVVRIEVVAEQVLAGAGDGAAYEAELGPALEAASADAVGLKSIVAYRGGFGFDPAAPERDEVVRAADAWLRRDDRSHLTDPVLLRSCLWTAAEIARRRHIPIQFHAGFGDPDLTLHLADPSLLTGLIRRFAELPVDVTLLHCYPYQRQAGYLAAVFPNVYFDVGMSLNYTGPSAETVLAEALEMAPFTKQLYSSDAFGLAELYLTGAVLFRRALDAVLGRWVAEGDCSPADAARIAALIASGNARRVYGL
jgi:hypothetical protein